MEKTSELMKEPEHWKVILWSIHFLSILYFWALMKQFFERNFCPLNKKFWGPLESTLINFKAGSRKLSERKRSYFILLVLCGKQVHNCLHVSFFIHECALFDKVINPIHIFIFARQNVLMWTLFKGEIFFFNKRSPYL